MFCGSADGNMLRPMVIYKAKNLYRTWCHGGPEGTEYSCTASGWFDAYEFRKWFFNVFLPHAKTLQGKKVLLGDNLSSHLTMDVIDACRNSAAEYFGTGTGIVTPIVEAQKIDLI